MHNRMGWWLLLTAVLAPAVTILIICAAVSICLSIGPLKTEGLMLCLLAFALVICWVVSAALLAWTMRVSDGSRWWYLYGDVRDKG